MEGAAPLTPHPDPSPLSDCLSRQVVKGAGGAPELLFFEQGVQDGEEFTPAGHQGHLGRFASGQERCISFWMPASVLGWVKSGQRG